jgi:hypothetical protein
MWAVLADAIAVLEMAPRHPTTRNLREARTAIEWIRDDDAEWPCSFRNVCEVLGLDAARLRMQLASKGLLR